MGKACVPVVPLHPLLCFSMLGLLCVEQDCSGLCSEMLVTPLFTKVR